MKLTEEQVNEATDEGVNLAFALLNQADEITDPTAQRLMSLRLEIAAKHILAALAVDTTMSGKVFIEEELRRYSRDIAANYYELIADIASSGGVSEEPA